MGSKIDKIQKFYHEAVALLDDSGFNPANMPTRAHRILHFWALVYRSFTRNRCFIRASALAYVTLLALIPMLAVVVSVTSSLLKKEGEERIQLVLEQFIASVMPPDLLSTNLALTKTNITVAVTNLTDVTRPPEAVSPAPVVTEASGTNVQEIVQTASATNEVVLPSFMLGEDALQARKTIAKSIHDFIQNTRSGTLGVTGTAFLIFVAISLLARVEDTFNDIWGVEQGRGWFTRVVLYWGVISLVPILLVVALGLATGPHLASTRDFLAAMPLVGSLTFMVLPAVLLSLTFGVFYLMIPNTFVDWRAALIGGAVGGTLFHVNNLASVFYVSRVVTYSKLYGSLGLVFVFMMGLYLAWLILLFGAQVAYAFQNRRAYLEEKQVENINQRGREFVALRVMTNISQAFDKGEPPPGITRISEELSVPGRLLLQVLQTLRSARLVVETAGTEPGWVPARPLDTISCYDVLYAMRAAQGQDLATRDEPVRSEVLGEFARIQHAEQSAASSVSMLTLAHRTAAKELPDGRSPQGT